MAEGPTIGTHRFEGQSLQTMYSWMHEQGNGPSSAGTARAALVELGTLLSDVERQMRTALKEIGIEWEGAAAAAAGQAIRQSANWVSDAGQVSMTSCRPAADQGESFTTTRAQIQQPQSAEYGFGDAMADGFNIASDIAIGPLNPFDIQTDVDQAAKQNAAHQAAAVQAMNNWNSAAQTNLAAMAPVDPPQPIAVDATPAGGAQQPTVAYAGSGPTGTAGGAGSGYSGAPSTVAPQHVGPMATVSPGAGGGIGPSPTGPAGSGGSPPPFLPGAPTPAQGVRPGAGGPSTGPGSSGAGAGIGPAVAGNDRSRSHSGSAGVPAGRGAGGLGHGQGLGQGAGQGGAARLGQAGLARLGPGGGLPGGTAEGAARAGSATPGAAGRGGGSFMQPAAAGARGRGSADDEHQNKYWQKDSEIFEDNRLVAPPVIGEDPPQ